MLRKRDVVKQAAQNLVDRGKQYLRGKTSAEEEDGIELDDMAPREIPNPAFDPESVSGAATAETTAGTTDAAAVTDTVAGGLGGTIGEEVGGAALAATIGGTLAAAVPVVGGIAALAIGLVDFFVDTTSRVRTRRSLSLTQAWLRLLCTSQGCDELPRIISNTRLYTYL